MPRHVFFQDVQRTSPQLSCDGASVGFIDFGSGARRLTLQRIGERARSIETPGPVTSWRWTRRGGGAIAVAGEPSSQRLLRIEADGDVRDITPIDAYGMRIVATAPGRPDEVIVSATRSGARALLRVSLLDGTAEPIPGAEAFTSWTFDHDLELVAAQAQRGYDTVLFRKAAGGWSPICSSSLVFEPMVGVLSASADGRLVYYTSNHDTDTSALHAIDRISGADTVLLEDETADLLPVGALVDPKTGKPEDVVSYHVRLVRHALVPDVEPDLAAVRTAHPGDVSIAGQSDDDRRWLIRYWNGGPATYSVYDRDTRRSIDLFSEIPDFDGLALAARHASNTTSRDGLVLPSDVYLPAGSDPDGDGVPTHPLPTIVVVHGGPWVGLAWNSWPIVRMLQFMASRGYAVVLAEFRGTVGFGRRFMEMGRAEWGKRMQDDVLDVTAACVSRGIAAPDRMAILGWSYGGYAALTTLATKPDVFRCGVDIYGISDLSMAMGNGPTSSDFWRARVGDPSTVEGKAALDAVSAMSHLDTLTAPVLITHGGADQWVAHEQSDQLVRGLRERHRTFTYVYFPEEQHDYVRLADWEAFWSVAERFLAQHLGGLSEPMGDEIERSGCVIEGAG